MSKQISTVDSSICAACGACAAVCPKDAISVWKGCYAVVDTGTCLGCGLCARICPAGAVSLIKKEASL